MSVGMRVTSTPVLIGLLVGAALLTTVRARAAALGQAAAQRRIAALPQRQAKICCSGDVDEMDSDSELLRRHGQWRCACSHQRW